MGVGKDRRIPGAAVQSEAGAAQVLALVGITTLFLGPASLGDR
jgi:hypothetical protein